MLAVRPQGLGTAWTTLHLDGEEEAARVLGIPFREVMQAALIPVAYTKGTSFSPGPPGRRWTHCMAGGWMPWPARRNRDYLRHTGL